MILHLILQYGKNLRKDMTRGRENGDKLTTMKIDTFVPNYIIRI